MELRQTVIQGTIHVNGWDRQLRYLHHAFNGITRSTFLPNQAKKSAFLGNFAKGSSL